MIKVIEEGLLIFQYVFETIVQYELIQIVMPLGSRELTKLKKMQDSVW